MDKDHMTATYAVGRLAGLAQTSSITFDVLVKSPGYIAMKLAAKWQSHPPRRTQERHNQIPSNDAPGI